MTTEHDRIIKLKNEITDLYHKIGKIEVWSAGNDEVCDMCEEYVLEKIKEIWNKKVN